MLTSVSQRGRSFKEACGVLDGPGNPPLPSQRLQDLAQGEISAGKLTEAEPYLTRWCAAQPKAVEPLLRRMDLWRRLKRLPQAIDDARQVLELQPENDTLRGQLVSWLLLTGRFE